MSLPAEYIEVVICPGPCQGRGFYIEHKLTNPHKREYETVNIVCETCQGSGRLNKRIKYELYKMHARTDV